MWAHHDHRIDLHSILLPSIQTTCTWCLGFGIIQPKLHFRLLEVICFAPYSVSPQAALVSMALYMIAGLIYTSDGLGMDEIETTTLIVLISTLCFIVFAFILWSFTILKHKREASNTELIRDYTVGAWVKVSWFRPGTRKHCAVAYMTVRYHSRRQRLNFASITLCCRLHDCALPFTQTTAALRLNIKNQDSFYELIGGKGQQSVPVSKLTGVCWPAMHAAKQLNEQAQHVTTHRVTVAVRQLTLCTRIGTVQML